MTKKDYEAMEVAIKSLHYNPELSNAEIRNYEDALANIRDAVSEQMADANEPLTWDELCRMDGEPVWLVAKRDGFSSWGIVRVFIRNGQPYVTVSCVERLYSGNGFYGALWVAYRRPVEKDVVKTAGTEAFVHCKDCIHWQPTGSMGGNIPGIPEPLGTCKWIQGVFMASDFCSKAERREIKKEEL